MPLDEIRKSIESATSGEIERVKREAEQEAEKIMEEAKSNASKILKDAEEKANAEAKSLEQSHYANLQFDIDSMLLSARNEVIEKELKQIRGEVEKELAKHADELLKAAIKDFSKIVNKDEVIVQYGKKYEKIAKESKLKAEPAEVDGFILLNGDRTVSLDATFNSMVDRNIAQIRKLIADSLPKLEGKKEAKIEVGKKQKARPAVSRKKEVKAKPKANTKKGGIRQRR